MEHTSEVFANAPPAFVVCEIRFPQAPRLTSDESFIALTDAFAGSLAIPEEERTDDGAERRFRFLDRRRRQSVVVARDSLSIETTDYTEWTRFKPFVLEAVDVVAATAHIVGVERIGLRYINEIRVPEQITDVTRWKRWISDEMLGPLGGIPGYSPAGFQTMTHLIRGDTHLHVRCAALVGSGVVSDHPLRRRTPVGEGPFFVIDTDSYSETPGEKMGNFTTQDLDPALDDLHEPLEALFHRAIRDELREVFRSEP